VNRPAQRLSDAKKTAQKVKISSQFSFSYQIMCKDSAFFRNFVAVKKKKNNYV
jgi:hypothetical protein